MKYTFTDNTGAEKTVTIPDEYIKKNKINLGLNNKEVILMWLSDEGYIEDPTVRDLCEKAKKGGKMTVGAKRKAAPKRREDPAKRAIIEGVYMFLMNGGLDGKLPFDHSVAPISITNPERIIAFQVGNDKYELTLSKKREPKA